MRLLAEARLLQHTTPSVRRHLSFFVSYAVRFFRRSTSPPQRDSLSRDFKKPPSPTIAARMTNPRRSPNPKIAQDTHAGASWSPHERLTPKALVLAVRGKKIAASTWIRWPAAVMLVTSDHLSPSVYDSSPLRQKYFETCPRLTCTQSTGKCFAMKRRIIEQLVKQHGAKLRADISRGVTACERVWPSKTPGNPTNQAELGDFCLTQYVPPGAKRNQLLLRLDEFHHSVAGSMVAAQKVTRAGQDIADLPLTPAESILGPYTPDNHLLEDYREFRIAALVQLNFGTDDRKPPKSRAAWAARRIGDLGREVIPAKLLAKLSQAQTGVENFISAYNLNLDKFDFGDRRIRFPNGTRLISHWGLRDTMTSLHGKPHALIKQRAILDLMRRVVDGEIPREVLDDPNVGWNIPERTITTKGKSAAAKGHGPLRWEKFHKVWQVHRRMDPFRRYGNLIDNKFLGERELREEKVVDILTQIVSSPLAERVARCLRDRLGRKLEPFDLYYRDFSPTARGKPALRFDIRKKYPNARALSDAIPEILVKLGWKRNRARWIGSKIRVDNGRSAGHAWPPYHDSDVQLLRVRVDKQGCDEINFETFMHELGHCVEGVLTSYEMDYKTLLGVPNTAFTEGFAFTFQDRTDQILGRKKRAQADAVTLQRFWEPFEIAGSALTEIRLFHWLYDNPRATPKQIMLAIRRIGDEVWEEFYARIFGPDSHGLMSVYSHIVWGEFYLAEYPLGYVIAYQIRKFLEGKPLPDEMERMCAAGRIYPEPWMKAAVGREISVEPLLRDTRDALKRMEY